MAHHHGSLYLGGQQLPSLPLVLTQEAIGQLLAQLAGGAGVGEHERLVAAHTLAHLLEVEEARYRLLVGDPHANPNLRSHYAIGKLLAAIKDDEDTYDAIVDSWVLARTASLEQQVAGLRLLHACLDCWLFQYPLTEEGLVEKLGFWAIAGISPAPAAAAGQQQGQPGSEQQQQQQPTVLGDPQPTSLTPFLEEAKATFALGLLGIALANEEYADEAVQTPIVPACCRYLQQAVLPHRGAAAAAAAADVQAAAAAANSESQQQQQQQQDHAQQQPQPEQEAPASAGSWNKHKAPAKSALKAAGAAGAPHVPSAAAAAAAGSSSQQQDEQQQQLLLPEVLPGNPALAAVARFQDGRVADDEVLQLRLTKLLGVMRCLTCTGEYVEALGPFLAHQGVECCCVLLRTWRNNGVLLNEALQVVCSLLAHRRFGELLVEQRGVQLLLDLPRTAHSNMGLSLTLFGLASLPLAFERTCSLPQPVPSQLVQAGLGLLAVPNDAARKNAALFFDAAVHYPVLLDCFDASDGLHRLLYPLQHVVQLLQAGGPAELRAERQVAYHASRALLQYIRAHLVLHLTSLQRRLRDGQASAAPPQPHKPINTSAAAVDELISALCTDAKLAEAFVRTRWPLLERLAQHRLVPLLLDLVRVLPGEERYFSDITLYGLEVLQLVTLSPLPRRAIIAATAAQAASVGGPRAQAPRSGMATLLHAASTGNATPFYGLADPEVIATALHVIVNCVTAPPSLAYLLPPPGSAAGGAAGSAAAGSGGVGGDKQPIEAHQTPQPADTPTQSELAAPPALELGPSAVAAGNPPSLGDALEAGYAAARQAVRSSNGIRVLLMLLQSRQHLAPTAADRVRALACQAVLGLARDASIRHILTKLQVGKLLAELVREPLGPGTAGGGGSRRDVNAGSEAGGGGNTGALWQERFHRAALELIAVTTSSGSGSGGRAETRLAAAAATDAAAPALLKIERAAIAASTPISYQPQELLLLMYEHLKASGLHSTAASLAREAGLAGGSKPAAAAALAAAAAAAVAAAAAQGGTPQLGGTAAGGGSPSAAGGLMGPFTASAAAAAALAAAAAAAGGGSNAVQQLAAADAAAAATAGASGGDARAAPGGVGGSSGSTVAGRERRGRLSLGPALLQQLSKEGFAESEQQQQQQPSQFQPHNKALLLSKAHGASGGNGRLPTPFAGSGSGGAGAGSGGAASGAGATTPAPPAPPTATAASLGFMSPAPALAASGGKRKAAAAAAGSVTPMPVLAGPADLELPPAKRQAVAQTPAGSRGSSAEADAAAAVAGAAPGALAAAVAAAAVAGAGGGKGHRGSPVAGSSRRGARTPPAARGDSSSDAEYLLALQQQQLQLLGAQGLEGVFHTQQPPATGIGGTQGLAQQPGSSSAAAAAAGGGGPSRPSRSPYHGPAATPSPGLFAGFGTGHETPIGAASLATPATTLPPPGSSSGGAGALVPVGGGTTPGAAVAAAAAAAAATNVNPLLTGLPSSMRWGGSGKGGATLLQRRLSAGADSIIPPHRLTSIAEAAPEPKPLPLHVQVAAREVMTGPPVNSRLGAIITAYLRQQHRAACLTAAQPVSVVPPVSLLKPYALPVATRPLNAPANVTLRLGRQEVWGGFGGRGGAAATRRLVWSRFRLTQMLRDDGPLLTACAFLRGFEVLAAGTASGELKLHDAYNGDTVDIVDAHTAPVNLLQASPCTGGATGDQLLLSSSRSEVLLWRADGFDTGPLYSWSGLARGRFNTAGSQVIGVSTGSTPRQAQIYDASNGQLMATLDEAAAAAAAAGVSGGSAAAIAGGGGGGGELVRGAASACFSPSGELVLWGATLWDPRVPVPLHTFDQLSSGAGGTSGVFHPNGGEILLNSEVWDLRTRKLLRSVPLLDGTSVIFSSGGDTLAAWLRRPADDSMAALLQPKRRRHALSTSFAILDARSYGEIANVQVERALLDLCLDPSDSFLAAVAVDIGGSLAEGSVTSSVRLYEVGRQKPSKDDEDASDDAAGEDEDDDDEESDESDPDGDGRGGMLHALLGDGDGSPNGLGGGGRDGGGGGLGGGGGGSDDVMTGGSDGLDDLDDEGVAELEEELADMYEQALAAGIDSDDLSISINDGDDGEGGDDDDEDGNGGLGGELDLEAEEELLAALEGELSSSSYETDDEAGG